MDRVEVFRKTERLVYLIKQKNTGRPREFAARLEVSERTLYRMLRMAEDMYGLTIRFVHRHNSYIIEE